MEILNLAAADLNHDSKLDFVVGTFGTQVITFIASDAGYDKTMYPGSFTYGDLTVADFSNDGIPDIMASQFAGQNFEYFLNNGNGVFTRSNVPSSLGAKSSVCSIDIDGNGLIDFIGTGYSWGRILTFKNLGSSFEEQPVFNPYGYYEFVNADDLDGDNVAEIIAMSYTKRLDIFKKISGQYQLAKSIITGSGASKGIIVSLDNDVYPEMITASSFNNTLSVYYGNSTGIWKSRKDWVLTAGVFDVDAADFNSDGWKDIVFVSNNSEALTGIILTDADGNFSDAPAIISNETGNDVAAGDFNGDGKMDFVTANFVYFGNGNGTFSYHSLNMPYVPLHIVVGEINGDEFPDLYVTDRQALHYAINNGSGEFSPTAVQTQAVPFYIKAADLNGDSKTDLLIGEGYGRKQFTVLMPSGTDAFSSRTIQSGADVYSVAPVDLNLDTKTDIVASADDPQHALLTYAQDQDGQFMFDRKIPIGNAPSEVLTADLNDDSVADIVALTPNEPSVRVVLSEVALEPTVLSSSLQANAGATTARIKLTHGNGNGRIILLREGQAIVNSPSDQTFYAANAQFRTGSNLGNETYVVMASEKDSVHITGLLEHTMYFAKVFEYNANDRHTLVNYTSIGASISFTTKTTQQLEPVTPVNMTSNPQNYVVIKSSSGLKTSLQIVSGNAVAKGDTLLINSPGPITVRVTQAGNDVYAAMDPQTITFCANPPKPAITAEGYPEVKMTSSSSFNNHWFKNGSAITSATGQHYVTSKSGVYSVKVDVGGCITESDPYDLTVTALELSLSNSVSIYPNPASNIVLIESDQEIRHVRIINALGSNVYEQAVNSMRHEISVESLPQGIYFIMVEKPDGHVTKKIYRE